MITVLNTGVANIASVIYALERLGVNAQVSDDAQTIIESSHVIFPGVGTANACLDHLKSKNLTQVLKALTQPVLGICLGMQIMYEHSEEGDVAGLGIFKGTVKRITPAEALPVPHMGWNQVQSEGKSRLLKGIAENSHFYYVHSFKAPVGPEMIASSQYGGLIPAMVERGNWFGAQFHPERSGTAGEQLLRNFLSC